MDPAAVKRLAELSRLLDHATSDYAVADEQSVQAKQAYEVARARAFLTAEGPVNQREAQALLDVADLRLGSEMAQAKVRAVQERIRTIRVQVDVGRSLIAAQRTEWAAGGSVT